MARDELFQHIIRCDVIGADPEHQAEWFSETMTYMTDRWHELTPRQVAELRTLGERFAKPARSATVVELTAPLAVTADEAVAESDAESLDTVSA
jgi:hypothetical protein